MAQCKAYPSHLFNSRTRRPSKIDLF
uniref:Uncharacterized protein n=1 Tax=Arundo donax TaxID=35708 RepID=A0A0A9H9U3_ARUDO